MGQTVHVYPVNDIVEHDTETDDCQCGPSIEAVPDGEGGYGYVLTHHSLDGREFDEPDHIGARPPAG
jgi:hypothetical protein